jgi:hypothetical protein
MIEEGIAHGFLGRESHGFFRAGLGIFPADWGCFRFLWADTGVPKFFWAGPEVLSLRRCFAASDALAHGPGPMPRV